VVVQEGGVGEVVGWHGNVCVQLGDARLDMAALAVASAALRMAREALCRARECSRLVTAYANARNGIW